MVKMILKDFNLRKGQAFRQAWSQSFIPLMLMAYAQSGIWLDKGAVNTKICWVWCICFLFITLLIHTMYPGKMPEAMYFVPMDRKERKAYLCHVFWVKVGGLFILQAFMESILLFNGICVWWQAILYVSSATLWSGVLGVTIQFPNPKNPMICQGKYGVRLVISYILSWFFCLCVSCTNSKTIALWEMIFLLVLYLIQVILCIQLIKKQFPVMLEQGMNYERIQ